MKLTGRLGTYKLREGISKQITIYNPDSLSVHLKTTNTITGIKVFCSRSKECLYEGINSLADSIDTLIFEFELTDTNSLGTINKEFILKVDHALLFPHLQINEQVIENFKDENDNKHPKIEITDKSWDFGVIKSGQKPMHTFKIKNNGNKNLIIRKIGTSCGCTSPVLEKRIIFPGKETRLNVQFKSFSKKENNKKTLEIFCNDPYHPIIEIQICGKIETRNP